MIRIKHLKLLDSLKENFEKFLFETMYF